MKAPVFVSVASVNYLALLLTLAQSLRRHVAGARVYAFISDASPKLIKKIHNRFSDGLEYIGSHDMNNPILESMRTYYSILEFNSACKIWALDYMLRLFPENDCIFVDPDTYALDDLTADLGESAHDVGLTAHTLHPYPDDGELPSEPELALAGYVNGGFIHVRNTVASRNVLAWLLRHTHYNWFVAPNYGMYADQQWLGLLPLFFPGTAGLLRDRTINIAYWNLHERPLRNTSGEITLAGEDTQKRAKLFHFSGFSVPSGGRVTRHSKRRFDHETEGVLTELISTYEQQICSQTDKIREARLAGDLVFSTRSLPARMKVAQRHWGIRHTELAHPGFMARLGHRLDAFFG